MSKTVTIPTDGMNPFVVIFNGVKYVYTPGETVEVPDGVALEIEEYKRWREKHPGENVPPFGVQPDLSQNDPTAADFVKGRTHWGEVSEVQNLDEVKVLTYWDAGSFVLHRGLILGETLTVTLNGNKYECVVWNADGTQYVGNGAISAIFGNGEDVPFLLIDVGESAILCTMIAGTNTISVADSSGKTVASERTYSTEGAPHSADILYRLELIRGHTYSVKFDGVQYECVARGNGTKLGNGSYMDEDGGEDVPFFFEVLTEDEAFCIYTHDGGEHTVSISAEIETIHKLDKKYLPIEWDAIIDLGMPPMYGTYAITFVHGGYQAIKDKVLNREPVQIAVVSNFPACRGTYQPTEVRYNENDSKITLSFFGYNANIGGGDGWAAFKLRISEDNSFSDYGSISFS